MPIKNCDGFVSMQQLIGLCLNVQFISGKLIKSESYNRVRNFYSLDCNELSCQTVVTLTQNARYSKVNLTHLTCFFVVSVDIHAFFSGLFFLQPQYEDILIHVQFQLCCYFLLSSSAWLFTCAISVYGHVFMPCSEMLFNYICFVFSVKNKLGIS